ncbi:hypothetical protein [Pedobacter cryotolerans]|uniref:Uncharacterized protein n=1 Tax=Pedobacter cryotolerans TaxID=2571270 RepID=A0A4U1CB92_9SPHI|nr:hypothetical protein [Pedobacter cryotolerans]TKC03198.1 hypothetical protein FA045_01100 [Pedobacter cryotolerans]
MEITLLIITLSIFILHVFLGYKLLKLKGHDNYWAYITLILSFVPLFWLAWGCTDSKLPNSKTRIWTYVSLGYGVLGVIYIIIKRSQQ